MHPLEYLFLHHSLLSTIAFFNKETRRSIQKQKQYRQRAEVRWAAKLKTRKQQNLQMEWDCGHKALPRIQLHCLWCYCREKKLGLFSLRPLDIHTASVNLLHVPWKLQRKDWISRQPMLDTRAPRKVKGFEYLNHGKASVGIFTLLDNRKCRVQICRKLVFFQFMDHRTICSGLQTSFYKLYQVTFRNPFHPELLSDSRKLGGI